MSRRATRRQAEPSHKKTKLESIVHVARWSDLNYDVVWDIFAHLSTVQKTVYRRVSFGWCSILSDQLSTSSVINLGYSDLKHWRTIFYPPVRETRKSVADRKIKLVTDKTRWIVLDFEYAKMSSYAPITVTCILDSDGCPMEDVVHYHPQICHIVLWRYLVTGSYMHLPEYEMLRNFGCGFGEPRSVEKKVTVTIYESGQCIQHKPAWNPDREERRTVRLWKIRWQKLVLRNETRGLQYWAPLWDQSQKACWQYPPDQLEWLENCLDALPSDDPLHRYVELEKVEGLTFHLANEFAVVFRGRACLKTVPAFCARYVTTFRQHLNLPPPPHPLSWND